MQEQKQTANRNYKDSVFVDLFGEDKNANRHYCTRNRFDHTGNRENSFIIFPSRGLSTDPTSNLFAAAVFLKRCFSALSTDTDVGGSKQKHVLLSKTCYQTCTRIYRFDNRSKNRTYIIRAAKRISASIAVRDTTFPISIYSSHTAVTRSVRRDDEAFFIRFLFQFISALIRNQI